MSRVALIADIHANLPAFEAVLQDARAEGALEIWCLGDLVGYGPFPNECVRLARETCSRLIIGNHDEKVTSSKKIARILDHAKEEYKTFTFSWTHRVLEADAASALRTLPVEDCFEYEGRKVALFHGSSDGLNDGVSLHTPEKRLQALALRAGVDLICVGHTHDVFVREVEGTVFVNPGSVGRPFDGDPRASYMLLVFEKDCVRGETRRIGYDLSLCLEKMRDERFPDCLVRAFSEARSPADLIPLDNPLSLMEAAQKLGVRYSLEKTHASHVTRLALKLFDFLAELHGLGVRERALLQTAAYLHDVGVVYGPEGHHKASRDIILEDKTLPLSERERVVVSLLARYHRKALPEADHSHFMYLPDHHKMLVERLGSILRVADGLDRSHEGCVKEVSVEVFDDEVFLRLQGEGGLDAEIAAAREKSDLFERAFQRTIRFMKK